MSPLLGRTDGSGVSRLEWRHDWGDASLYDTFEAGGLMAAERHPGMPVQQYLDIERMSPIKHEYVDGVA